MLPTVILSLGNMNVLDSLLCRNANELLISSNFKCLSFLNIFLHLEGITKQLTFIQGLVSCFGFSPMIHSDVDLRTLP